MPTKVLIGNIKHQSKGNKNLIITLQADARIGQNVFDKNGKQIGKIFDIFGPVISPYASIKLNDKVELGKSKGKPLFLIQSPTRKKKHRKK